MRKIIKSFIEEYQIDFRFLKKNLFYISIISAIYFLPYLTSDIPFDDDFARRIWGDTDHCEMGRPFAGTIISLISYKIRIGFNITAAMIDIAPLNQIVTLVILVLIVSIFLTRIYNTDSNFFSSLIGFSFIANPFYLQIFSYTSDSIIISTSNAIALLASLNLKHKKIDLIIGTLLSLIFISSYQSSINTFLAATFFLFLINYKKSPKESFILLINNFSKLFIAIVIYKFFILSQITKLSLYYLRLQELLKFDNELGSKLIENFILIFKESFLIFSENWVLIIFSLISVITFAIQFVLINKQPIKSLFVFLICFFGIIISIIGFLCVCAHPSVEPRVFASFSVFITFIFYSFYISIAQKQESLKILMLIPIVFFFITSYGYRSMTMSQIRFQRDTALEIKSDLERLGLNDDSFIKYKGYLDFTRTLSLTFNNNKVLKGLSREHLKDDWYYNILFKYIGLHSQFNRIPEHIINQACNSNAKVTTPLYKITNIEQNYIVAFKNSECFQTMK